MTTDCSPSLDNNTDASAFSLPDAETLYQQLCTLLQPLRTPQTQVVGITSGGAWIAQRLQQQWGLDSIGTISTAMHRDDFAKRGLAVTAQTQLPFEVDGADILLLDDVLYTGRTLRAVLNELFDYGRPACVRLAVLVDRGGRQLPVAAEFAAARVALPSHQSLELARAPDGRFSFRVENRG